MSKHSSTRELDMPSIPALRYLQGVREEEQTVGQYSTWYDNSRIYAEHRLASYESNRFEGLYHPYRETTWDMCSFAEQVNAASGMISTSDGWAPNRALRIYTEAIAENAAFDYLERAIETGSWAANS